MEVDASLLKSEVCPYIGEAGYVQSKSILLQAAEGFAGWEIQFPILGTLDIVMGALLDLCGFYRRGCINDQRHMKRSKHEPRGINTLPWRLEH